MAAVVVAVHTAAVAADLAAAVVVVRTEVAVARTATVTKNSLGARPAPGSGAGFFSFYRGWLLQLLLRVSV